MLDLQKYRSAIFDCDGVILDSNAMKSRAFRMALEGEAPHLVDQFINYHHEHGGVSRYLKFLYFFRDLKGEKDYEGPARKANVRYSALSRQGLLECEEIPGVRKFLEHLQKRKTSCFLISGGDEEEVQYILKQRGLSSCFDKIMGSPATKADHLEGLLHDQLLKTPSIYFGDARVDMEAALSHQLDFVFVSNRSEWGNGLAICQEKGISIIPDFSSL